MQIRAVIKKYGILGIILLLGIVVAVLYRFNYIPHKMYTNEEFGITAYVSVYDKDKDGAEDQTDILQNAKSYVQTNPKYKSKYYETGYPNDGYGVCTDVIAFALKGAGYDLMELVNEDILKEPTAYNIEKPDKNIDFRRVRNLSVYFQRNALSLTTDIDEIAQWQGGDIVLWKGHIGIVSDHRNQKGVPFVIHNANPIQAGYEEDILAIWGKITGHYRITGE